MVRATNCFGGEQLECVLWVSISPVGGPVARIDVVYIRMGNLQSFSSAIQLQLIATPPHLRRSTLLFNPPSSSYHQWIPSHRSSRTSPRLRTLPSHHHQSKRSLAGQAATHTASSHKNSATAHVCLLPY